MYSLNMQLDLLFCELKLLSFCVKVENLFYNMAARRKTLQNSADDYPKIVDLISRFAIHHINVGFSCRKVGVLSGKPALRIV